MTEWEEDDRERRARRRAARDTCALTSFVHAHNECGSKDRFGSNITTSSVSSIRTKNTFLEVSDELERLEMQRMRSNRSRSLPPDLEPQVEENQVWITSFILEQLTSLTTPPMSALATPQVAECATRRRAKHAPLLEEQEKRGRLFVGGLAIASTDESLRTHFAPYGDLVEANVILDKRSKNSRGFGFVAFRDGYVPPRVLTDEHVIDGKVAGVRLYGSEPAKPKIAL